MDGLAGAIITFVQASVAVLGYLAYIIMARAKWLFVGCERSRYYLTRKEDS